MSSRMLPAKRTEKLSCRPVERSRRHHRDDPMVVVRPFEQVLAFASSGGRQGFAAAVPDAAVTDIAARSGKDEKALLQTLVSLPR
ncbi:MULTISPECIES: hypothetical protein [unclassified Rhizobium]|uniref:hypothetical protein n=1 Tax=unclassified Rhizobium TaxID=2613769 RepID=UPI00146F5011|nr:MULTISPECIES: hypothetical protein [unclassified Rhizobium]MBD9447243.1 hypothetical protein [Rhizobium sp. RHZ01]MBD9450461.1 hypothetical protein [Rhizobium sp. RHZ02]